MTATMDAPASDTEKKSFVNKNKTWLPKAVDTDNAEKKWHVIDVQDAVLGRVAVQIADVLLGKHTPRYTPGQATGDYVIVVNAEKVMVSGNKFEDKLYRRNSQRPGGLKTESFKELQARIPQRIIEKAVWGMLPKNRYGRELFRHLKVYKGPDHPHEAQTPVPMSVSKGLERKTGSLAAKIITFNEKEFGPDKFEEMELAKPKGF